MHDPSSADPLFEDSLRHCGSFLVFDRNHFGPFRKRARHDGHIFESSVPCEGSKQINVYPFVRLIAGRPRCQFRFLWGSLCPLAGVTGADVVGYVLTHRRPEVWFTKASYRSRHGPMSTEGSTVGITDYRGNHTYWRKQDCLRKRCSWSYIP